MGERQYRLQSGGGDRGRVPQAAPGPLRGVHPVSAAVRLDPRAGPGAPGHDSGHGSGGVRYRSAADRVRDLLRRRVLPLSPPTRRSGGESDRGCHQRGLLWDHPRHGPVHRDDPDARRRARSRRDSRRGDREVDVYRCIGGIWRNHRTWYPGDHLRGGRRSHTVPLRPNRRRRHDRRRPHRARSPGGAPGGRW